MDCVQNSGACRNNFLILKCNVPHIIGLHSMKMRPCPQSYSGN
uniref:Uncharacterized protein n=1 Tax=Anguilla anguilla TaxID=7936 RepID=A0A0E9T0C8_ANGAN